MAQEFLKVKCEKCKNEQVIFSRASSKVDCLVCGESFGETTGGRIKLTAKSVMPVK